MGRELLFVVSTLFWCQSMPNRLLYIYAASVTLTAVLKYLFFQGE